MPRVPVLAIVLALMAFGVPALAQDTHPFLHNANPSHPLFECGPKTMGQVGCQAGVRCKCLYDAFGSAMRGLPPGYRWDCGLEQGNCMNDVPATTSGTYGTPQNQAQPQQSIVIPVPNR